MFVSPNLHHRLNKSCMLIGLGIPNIKWTALHKKLAYAQSKTQVLDGFVYMTERTIFSLFKFRLARLSLIRITPLFKYHIKILIFIGIFAYGMAQV
jgi:hypothetical protein